VGKWLGGGFLGLSAHWRPGVTRDRCGEDSRAAELLGFLGGRGKKGTSTLRERAETRMEVPREKTGRKKMRYMNSAAEGKGGLLVGN